MTGGPFFRFTVGRTGASAAHMRYISRPAAVIDRLAGVRLRGFPPEVERASGYADLRTNLLAYAAMRETVERRVGAGRRTHYRVTISFEAPVRCAKAKAMAVQWLTTVLPRARAVVFLHRDTAYNHLHLWIDARQTDGRKICLSAAAYRRLDEAWNRIWARELRRDERLHLTRKRETEGYRTLRREGKPVDQPPRAARKLCRKDYRERELQGVGAYELDVRGPRRDKPEAAARPSGRERRERAAAPGERALERSAGARDRAADADALALRELHALREDAARVAARKRDLVRGPDRRSDSRDDVDRS